MSRSGLDNAGKTTICKALLGEDVDEVSPTLGFNIRTIIHRGYTLSVCAYTASRAQSRSSLCSAHTELHGESTGDIGGQTSLRPYWRNYFEQTDAVVWVVDSSDRARMDDCKRELHALLQEEVRSGRWSRYSPPGRWTGAACAFEGLALLHSRHTDQSGCTSPFRAEAARGESARLCEQAGYPRSLVCRRDFAGATFRAALHYEL